MTSGITTAIRAVLDSSNIPSNAITCVIIGTTHFVNAVVQRSPSLQPVAVVRLCGGGTDGFGLGVPPFIDFPEGLAEVMCGGTWFCEGGNQITGSEISALDEGELARVGEEIVESGVWDVVVAGIYSPVAAEHEKRTGEVLLRRMGSAMARRGVVGQPRVTLSHEISAIGFLARENAAILNASLKALAERTIWGFQQAMDKIFRHEPCSLYLTQNEGSVLAAADAINLPIRTFNSGPTNSIRGGKFLWDAANSQAGELPREREDALVVIDIGGTTSDSGLLLPNGLPQMSSVMSYVGGVRTNFALPAVESVGLGGGSVVRSTSACVTVGPDSVAMELQQRARLWGGDVLTATDIVATDLERNHAEGHPLSGLGNLQPLSDISLEVIDGAKQHMLRTIEDLVDRTKVSKDDVDVLIVGGGAILIDTDRPLRGVRKALTVAGGEVANAVGAAISRASGVIDTVVSTAQQTAKQAQSKVRQMAIEAAVLNGALRDTVEIAEVNTLPVQYVDAKVRLIVRAVGTLNPAIHTTPEKLSPRSAGSSAQSKASRGQRTRNTYIEPSEYDLASYRPTIKDGQWIISLQDLDWIANGCKVLGCGGGGDPYENYLKIKRHLEKYPESVKVVDAFSLPAAATVGWTGCLGSPEVSAERMEANECNKAHDEMTRVLRLPPVDAFIALEIGGGNGVVNLEVAATHGVPVVDGDYMGRAYPTGWQTTPNVYGTAKGEALVPATIASGDGSFMTLTETRTDKLVDSILRAATVEMGCRAGHAGPPKAANVVQQQAILNTVSLAWWVGRAIAVEKTVAEKPRRIIEALGGVSTAKILGHGKILSVERVLKTGHSYGVVEVEAVLMDESKAIISIPFKNENAYVTAVLSSGEKRLLASVPDLIAVLDAETGQGLGTQEYKYGLKVTIIAITASPRWTDTARGLELGGSASMGFADIEYRPIGRYCKPRSVIEAFS